VYIAGLSGLLNAVIQKTTIENQTIGLFAGANARVTTRGSVYSGNSNSGIVAQGGGQVNQGGGQVNIDRRIVTNNSDVGLYSGPDGILRVANSFIPATTPEFLPLDPVLPLLSLTISFRATRGTAPLIWD
jgi:hypothetical protein